jgi:iron complex transport system substrate-binding protein
MVLLGLACLSLISATVSAQYIVVPGDADGDMIVSDKEIELAEQSCDEGKITSDELEEIRHIHEAYPITIVDSADRVVTIYKPVERIIIQPTSSYEPIWILGAQDRVVGVTNTAKDLAYTWLPGIQNKSSIGEYKELDYEKIIELKPDIALVSNSGIETKKIDEILEPAGITVVGAEFVELETFDSELKNIAEILEAEERAEIFSPGETNTSIPSKKKPTKSILEYGFTANGLTWNVQQVEKRQLLIPRLRLQVATTSLGILMNTGSC